MTTPSHVPDDVLTALAHEVLAPAARRDALDHLRRCPTCEARFRREVADRERLASRLGASIASTHGDPPAEAGPRPPGDRDSRALTRIAAVVGAAAAILLVIPGLGSWPDGPSAIDPSAYWLPTDLEPAALRSPEGSPFADPGVQEGLAAYAHRDPARAVDALAVPARTRAHDGPLALYLADGLLRTGDPVAARALLDRADPATMPPPWRGRGRWIEARVLEAVGDTAGARAVLGRLTEDDPELAEAARRWLRARTPPPHRR